MPECEAPRPAGGKRHVDLKFACLREGRDFEI